MIKTVNDYFQDLKVRCTKHEFNNAHVAVIYNGKPIYLSSLSAYFVERDYAHLAHIFNYNAVNYYYDNDTTRFTVIINGTK